MSPDVAKCSLGGKLFLVENHCFSMRHLAKTILTARELCNAYTKVLCLVLSHIYPAIQEGAELL